MIDFDTFTNIPEDVGDLSKLIVAKGFKISPKDQYIAHLGFTVHSTIHWVPIGCLIFEKCMVSERD